MSDPASSNDDSIPLSKVIRIETELRDQLAVLADVRETTLTEEIRSAFIAYIEAAKQDPIAIELAHAMCARIGDEAAKRIERTARTFGFTEYVQPFDQPSGPRGVRRLYPV